jgi:hypothetical protein
MALNSFLGAGRGKVETGFPSASRPNLLGIDHVHDFGLNQSKIIAI